MTHMTSKLITTRAETKAFLDDTMSILSNIESLSVEYWLSGRKNRIDSDQFILVINAKLFMLFGRLQLLKTRNVDTELVDLAGLSTLITEDCEDVDRRSNEENRERVQLLLDKLNETHEKLYENFQSLYKPTFKWF